MDRRGPRPIAGRAESGNSAVNRNWYLAGAALAVLCLAVPAWASDKRVVYSPLVHEGEKEIEYYLAWHEESTGENVVLHEAELEWGATAHDSVAAYASWEELSDTGSEMTGYKLEWIHQFFEQGEHAWDVASYIEYAMTDRGDADRVETKVLLEHTFPRTTLTLNPVLEKEVGEEAEEGVEAAYGARWALRLSPVVEPAVELYGDLGEVEDLKDWPETRQLLGPVVDVRLGRRFAWQAGALFGLTRDSEDVRLKTLVAVEWY
jgi:hypothetical protein